MPSLPRLTGFDDENLRILNTWLMELEDHKRKLEEMYHQVRRLVHKNFPANPGVNTN